MTGKKQPQWSVSPEKAGGHYSNVVKVQSSPFDFVLDFGKKMPDKDEIVLESRITLSPEHMKAFVDLVANHYGLYEKRKKGSDEPPSGMYFDDFRFQR